MKWAKDQPSSTIIGKTGLKGYVIYLMYLAGLMQIQTINGCIMMYGCDWRHIGILRIWHGASDPICVVSVSQVSGAG